jgi:ribosome biogenesis GTPase
MNINMTIVTEKNHANEQLGLVISYFGNSVAVEDDNGQVFQCHLHRNQELPVVGDLVHWLRELEGNGTITEIIPRRSLLSRGDHRGKMKPIAANIDEIFIVMAPPPLFSEYLIDRYLVAAELLQIKPVIVLNKMDLLLDDTMKDAVSTRLLPYQSIPYPVVFSSVKSKNGLDELAKYLKNKTAVLMGPSGVGKSSIIASLAENDIKVQAVSPKGAGKHTTTATKLYHLPHGGSLIDSPGVREFNLWPITKKEVLKGFREFFQYAGDCKFRDCLHTVEPGCAVQKAGADGKVGLTRLTSYQTLIKDAYRPIK